MWAWAPAFLIQAFHRFALGPVSLGIAIAIALHLSAFFASFTMGQASDRYGRRAVLLARRCARCALLVRLRLVRPAVAGSVARLRRALWFCGAWRLLGAVHGDERGRASGLSRAGARGALDPRHRHRRGGTGRLWRRARSERALARLGPGLCSDGHRWRGRHGLCGPAAGGGLAFAPRPPGHLPISALERDPQGHRTRPRLAPGQRAECFCGAGPGSETRQDAVIRAFAQPRVANSM
jgi:hypothetical protein